jgi:4-amino-4-deoxy-L-arabinose transferase-like glycosyltransferase
MTICKDSSKIVSVILFSKYREIWLLLGACLVLTILWLPGYEYATVADTADYAVLGKNVWEHGIYALPGQVVKYLPLYPILSYPFTHAFGAHLGMKLASLLSGWGVLILSFLIARRQCGKVIAWGTVGALVIHHGFILMTTFGASDLLFTALSLLSLLFFLEADEKKSRYVPAGIALGLACLTRYNGFPFIVFFFIYACWKRRQDLRLPSFWIGSIVSGLLPALWFLYRMLLMGSALPTQYIAEQQLRSPHILLALAENFLYYINPLHNVLPVFLLFGLYGLWMYGRKEKILTGAMLCLFIFPAFWWSLGIRHAFAGYTIFLMFAVLGISAVYQQVRYKALFLTAVILALICTHVPTICIYSYGSCNAWVDRTIGIIPPYMGLTQEGLHSWEFGRQYINAHAESGSAVILPVATEAEAIRERFRSDLFVETSTGSLHCPSYEIMQGVTQTSRMIVTAGVNPPTYIDRIACPGSK